MAVIFDIEPPVISWAYNRQYFRFTSDTFFPGGNVESCDIIVSFAGGAEIVTISLFPDPDGYFTFDTLGILKSIFSNREDDSLTYNVAAQPLGTELFKSLLFEFSVNFDNGAGADTDSKIVVFIKGFAESNKQTGVPAPDSNSKLDKRLVLMPELSYYWEGYPFEYSFFDASEEEIKRNVISDGVPNAATIDEAGFKRVVDAETGIYLKWFNSRGGYSYWRFSCVGQQKIESDSTGKYRKPPSSDFSSLPKLNEAHDLNREITYSLTINSVFSLAEQELLTSLLNSNEVYLFDAPKGTEVNSSDEFFRRVSLSKNELEFNSKRQQFEVELELISYSSFNLNKLIKENNLIFTTLVDGIDGQKFEGFYIKSENEESVEVIGVKAAFFTGSDSVQTLNVNGSEFEIQTTLLKY